MADDPTTLAERNVSGSGTSSGPTASIVDEIESRSGYYQPSVYQILDFYNDFQPETDSNLSFVPVSQTSPNTKLFVVGIIPPDVNLTGRLLNRSATVSDIVGNPESTADRVDVPTEGTDELSGTVNPVPSTGGDGTAGASLPLNFWVEFVQMCDRLGCDPHEMASVIDKESKFDPRNQNKGPAGDRREPIAQGLNQFTRSTALGRKVGMDEDTWASYSTLSAEEQLPFVENFYRNKVAGKDRKDINVKTFGGYNNPDGSLYASVEAQAAWLADNPGDVFLNPEKQARALELNPRSVVQGPRGPIITKESLSNNLEGFPRAEIAARVTEAQEFILRNNLSSNQEGAPNVEDDTRSANFQAEGSPSQARKEISKGVDRNTNLTAQLNATQEAEFKVTARALENMRSVPPLRLLVNPSSFKLSSEKIVSDGNWTRNGPIIEHWGENQDKIDASGKVAAFFTTDSLGMGPGLTRGARQYSASYQNFMSLYMLYRNNANLYTVGLDFSDSKGSFRRRLSMLGSMYIFYDDTLYVGSFDNFNITENETSPYTLEYNFQFTVRATFLLDRQAPLSAEGSQFIRRKLVLGTTTPETGDEDFSSVSPEPLPDPEDLFAPELEGL